MTPLSREGYIVQIAARHFWEDMARPAQYRTPLDRESANSLLLSCLFNRGLDWQRAMSIVDEMKRRSLITDAVELFGSLSVEQLEFLMFDDPVDYSVDGGRNGALHRYRYMAQYASLMSKRLVDVWGGDARNMYADEPLGSELQERLMAFKGVGRKISSMQIRIWVLSNGVVLFNGYQGIDVSPDRCVRRVMVRLGLVAEDCTPQDIINKARELSPLCAVECEGMFVIGQDFCHADLNTADCRHCDLSPACNTAQRTIATKTNKSP